MRRRSVTGWCIAAWLALGWIPGCARSPAGGRDGTAPRSLSDLSTAERKKVWARAASLHARGATIPGRPGDRRPPPTGTRLDCGAGERLPFGVELSPAEWRNLDAEARRGGWADDPICHRPEGPIRMHAFVVGPSPEAPLDARPTPEACRDGVRGVVILQLLIEATGRVQDVEVLRGLPAGLTERAVAAARRSRWRPALLCGRPLAAYFDVTVRFDGGAECDGAGEATTSAEPGTRREGFAARRTRTLPASRRGAPATRGRLGISRRRVG